MIAFAGIVLGLALLVGGGALLVRGACEVAAKFGVSPMIIGLTIVGFGTSMPELVVNLTGAAAGATDIAFGNVIGSNIGNLALVLGLAAIMTPIVIKGEIVRRELPLLLLATTMLTVMALDWPLDRTESIIVRTDAVVLLLVFSIFMYVTVLQLRRIRSRDPLLSDIGEHPAIAPDVGRWRWLMVLGGFALLFFGGELTIRSSVAFAAQLGISATIIGLFVVALGTSMPELITSAIAAMKNEPDLAVGNVVGSNFFNSLIVLPASALITPIEIPRLGIGDLIFSLALTAALIPLFYIGGPRLGRPVGFVFVAVYAAYAVIRVFLATP